MVGRIVSHNDNRAEIKKTQLLNETHKPTIEEQSRNCSESEQELQNGAEPIGEVIRVSDNGIERKKHFKAFEYDGNLFKLVSSFFHFFIFRVSFFCFWLFAYLTLKSGFIDWSCVG